PHRARLPDPQGQLPRVDPFDADDARDVETLAEGAVGPRTGRSPGRLADREPGDVDAAALRVGGVHAVVALLGSCHRHDLTAIRRVGEDLLVAGHPRVEDGLAERLARRAEPRPPEDGPVLEGQECGRSRHRVAFPSETVSSPCRTVWRTRPRRARPMKALFLDFETNGGSTVHGSCGSNTTRFAGRPPSIGPPWSLAPMRRA